MSMFRNRLQVICHHLTGSVTHSSQIYRSLPVPVLSCVAAHLTHGIHTQHARQYSTARHQIISHALKHQTYTPLRPILTNSSPPFLPPLSEYDEGRLTLVFDMDETLVHSSLQPIRSFRLDLTSVAHLSHEEQLLYAVKVAQEDVKDKQVIMGKTDAAARLRGKSSESDAPHLVLLSDPYEADEIMNKKYSHNFDNDKRKPYDVEFLLQELTPAQSKFNSTHDSPNKDVVQGCLEQDWVISRFRPGLIPFLNKCRDHFHIVIFTSAMQVYAEPLLDRIEQLCDEAAIKEIMETQGKQKEEITLNKLFRHRLYRPSTRLVAGRHIKDVSCLGTDMKRTLLIDNDANAMLATPDNAILVHDYLGSENDKLFEDLLPMLAYLSTQEDIRPELIKHFRIREEMTKSHFKIVEPAVSTDAQIKK